MFGLNICAQWMTLDTAFIASRGGWIYCDDSRVQQTDAKEVVVCLTSDCIMHLADDVPTGTPGLRIVL